MLREAGYCEQSKREAMVKSFYALIYSEYLCSVVTTKRWFYAVSTHSYQRQSAQLFFVDLSSGSLVFIVYFIYSYAYKLSALKM
jgi:hypothetical protein